MDFVSNNHEKLKNLIKTIAQRHAKEMDQTPLNNLVGKYEFDLVLKSHQVISSHFFDNFDPASLTNEVKTLNASLNRILDLGILVKHQDLEHLVPPPFEVINLIFLSTNETFRQRYFLDLMDFYYEELSKNINKGGGSTIYTRKYFDQEVKVLLPCVKITTAFKLLNQTDQKSQKQLEDLVSNLALFFKYPRLNLEDIYLVIYNKLNSKSFKLLSYELVPLDMRNGHLGDYFTLKIIVEFEDRKQILTLFAKFITPTLDSMKELVLTGPSKREEFFYTCFLPLLEKHGLGSIVDFCPRCYFSRMNDVLILEDMSPLGYTALTPNIKLEYDCLRLVVNSMAKLHACSMLLEEILSSKEGKVINLHSIYEEYFEEAVFNPNNSKFIETCIDAFVGRMLYAAQKFPELIQNICPDILKEKVTNGWNLVFKQITKSEKLKNAVCHGDMYVANMLFRFGPSGQGEESCIVDFQMLRYCPPVHDLLFFIYQNSFKDTRDKYFRQLVEEYYLDLSRHLKTFNYDIDKIYPKSEYEESIEYMKSQGLFQALYYAPFTMIEPTMRENIFQNDKLAQKYFYDDKTAIIDLGMKDENYKRAFHGLIADLVEFCESEKI